MAIEDHLSEETREMYDDLPLIAQKECQIFYDEWLDSRPRFAKWEAAELAVSHTICHVRYERDEDGELYAVFDA